MQNDRGAYYLLIITEPDGSQTDFEYDNAEAARKHARMNEQSNPRGLRHLFKMLQGHDPVQVMV